jgi:opacity protein-like surface antigen
MKKTVTVLCSAILLSTSAYAGGKIEAVSEVEPVMHIESQEAVKNFYAGLGISVGQVKSHYYGKDTVIGVTAKAGYNFSEYFAVEFRGSKGLRDGDQLGLDYSYGLYLKPQYPLNEKVNLYGLLGYAQTKISFDKEVAFNGISNNYTTQSGLSFGVGLDYQLNKNWSLFVDVMRLIDKSTTRPEGKYAIQANALTFGFVYHF